MDTDRFAAHVMAAGLAQPCVSWREMAIVGGIVTSLVRTRKIHPLLVEREANRLALEMDLEAVGRLAAAELRALSVRFLAVYDALEGGR